jgi:hypothetical protein
LAAGERLKEEAVAAKVRAALAQLAADDRELRAERARAEDEAAALRAECALKEKAMAALREEKENLSHTIRRVDAACAPPPAPVRGPTAAPEPARFDRCGV